MSASTVRRPTAIAGVAMLTVVAFAVNDASATYGGVAFLAAAGGGLLAVATGLATRDEPLAVFLASVLAPAGGATVLAAVGLSVADFPLLDGVLDPLVLLGVAAAAFGVVAAFTGGVGGGAVGRAFSVVVATTALPFVATIVALLAATGAASGLLGNGLDLAVVLGHLLVTPTGDAIDVVVFFVLVAAAARALASGVDAAPVVELVPRHRREDAARATRYVVAASLSIWRLFALGWAFVFLAFLTGFASTAVDRAPDPLVSLVGTLASAGALRLLLLGTIAISVLVVVSLRAARLVTGDHRESLRRVAPTAGGGVLAVVVGFVFAGQVVGAVRQTLPAQVRPGFGNVVAAVGEPALALAGLLAPLAGLATLLLLFAGLGRLRAVPQRGAPAAVAAAGLVLAAAFAGIQNASPGFVFGLVAAGMVVWDVGEYGVGLAAELQRRAPTARAELVHVAATVAVGVVAYYAALFVDGYARGFGTPSTTAALVALAAAALGLAALVGALAE